jgi:hypothetical protein
MLMDFQADNTVYESAAHSDEICIAWLAVIIVRISHMHYIKIFACGNSHAASEL